MNEPLFFGFNFSGSVSRVSAEEAEEYPQLNVINVKSCGPHCSHFIELFYIECYLIRTVLEIFVLDFKGQIHYWVAPVFRYKNSHYQVGEAQKRTSQR